MIDRAVIERYDEYLARFAAEVGELAHGAFAKYGGRLIKKLTLDEFAQAFREYAEIEAHYRESLERGDTVNDLALRLLREKAASLVIAPPA